MLLFKLANHRRNTGEKDGFGRFEPGEHTVRPMLDDLITVATAALIVVTALRQQIREWRRPSDVDSIHQAYREGRIDEAELEQRLELTLDDRNERIRETVEQVNGVGRATSAALAHEFESVEALREADAERLQEVNGVGPKTAAAICDRL